MPARLAGRWGFSGSHHNLRRERRAIAGQTGCKAAREVAKFEPASGESQAPADATPPARSKSIATSGARTSAAQRAGDNAAGHALSFAVARFFTPPASLRLPLRQHLAGRAVDLHAVNVLAREQTDFVNEFAVVQVRAGVEGVHALAAQGMDRGADCFA